ncbi:MAG: histidine phosphatase family protein [Candidatus Heimdallarchaeota archaeon]|nr:histidine phosphatase family protein [Candidatus Heimdallarchaeota archaeon]
MILTLYVLRHGQSTGNLIRQFQSQLDTELTELGYEQARNLQGNIEVSIVYHSPLKRASETAKTIFESTAELVEMQGLIEDDVGMFIGKLYPDLTQEELEIWEKVVSDPDYVGHGGESRNQLKERSNHVMYEIVTDMVDRNILKAAIVAHGGILNAFLRHQFGSDIVLANCEPIIIRFDIESGKFEK